MSHKFPIKYIKVAVPFAKALYLGVVMTGHLLHFLKIAYRIQPEKTIEIKPLIHLLFYFFVS